MKEMEQNLTGGQPPCEVAKMLARMLCQMIESDLKERKKRGEKKKSPRTPLIKEKQPEKIEKETSVCVGDAKEEFRQECLRYIGQYDKQLVIDFYYYWSETSKRGTMREE